MDAVHQVLAAVSIKHSVRKMLLHKNSIHYYAAQSSVGYRLLLPAATSQPDLRTDAYNTRSGDDAPREPRRSVD